MATSVAELINALLISTHSSITRDVMRAAENRAVILVKGMDAQPSADSSRKFILKGLGTAVARRLADFFTR